MRYKSSFRSIGILFLLIFGFITESVFAQQSHTLKGCNRYDLQKSLLVIHCKGEAAVSLRPLSSTVVKIWADIDGTFRRKNPSFSVIKDSLSLIPEIKVRDRGNHWQIATGKFQLRVQKSSFSLSYYNQNGHFLGGDVSDDAYSWDGKQWRWKRKIKSQEKILGLGEKAGSLVRNGNLFTMWNSDHPCYGSDTDPLYKSIPFYMSTRHYGIFVDNTYKTKFDVGQSEQHQLSVKADGGPLVYYVIKGSKLKNIIDQYTQLTGRPMMPPKWAFGYAQSRGFYTNEELTRSVAHTLRAHRIPSDIIYQDIGWVDKLQNFKWDPERYNNPKGMLDDLQKQGFKVIVSQDPIISKRNRKQWQAVEDKNLFVLDRRNGKPYNMPWPWGGPGSLMDFTKEATADYWGKLQQKVVDQGVDGFWTDMGEPAWSNLDAPDRSNMQHAAGPHAEIHNVYGFTWDQIVTNQWRKRNGNRRIFQMTRAAFAGMQRFTFGWSGDSGCSDNILEDWERLADQVRIGQSAGLGGLVFWSSDISGYCGEINDYKAFAPIYVRWMQFGMFNSLSRVHHNGNWAVEPWQFGKKTENIVRKVVERRYRLFPYIYTYARQSYDTGLPLMRTLALEYPDDKEALKADTEFMFGDELLVAPVVSDTTIRRLYLPNGDWVDYNHPSRVEKGGRWITQKAPLSETPIWVKAGSIIPKMPVMQYIHQDTNYPVILDVYPYPDHGQSKFELYEDDGLTYNYEQDESSRTTFSVSTLKDGLKIEVGARRAKGYTPPSPRNLIFKIHIPEPRKGLSVFAINENQEIAMPAQALTKILDYKGSITGWTINKAENILYIKIPDTGNTKVFKIKFE